MFSEHHEFGIDVIFLQRFKRYIGKAFHLYRLKNELTQGELSALIPVRFNGCQSYISRMENGQANISLNQFAILCSVLNCTPKQIIELAENLANKPQLKEKHILVDCLSKEQIGADKEVIDNLVDIINQPYRKEPDYKQCENDNIFRDSDNEAESVLSTMTATVIAGDTDPKLVEQLRKLGREGKIPLEAICRLVDIIDIQTDTLIKHGNK